MQHWPWQISIIRGVLRVFNGVELVAVENCKFKLIVISC